MPPQPVDITPRPRILRTLGEIPFQPWQCLAELIDNSLDAFTHAERIGMTLPEKKIIISWSSESVAASERTVEILDTAQGMGLEQIRNTAQAGYSGNDPIENLGLFGMGFNIATAKLGERTRILSTVAGAAEWIGIEIDFASLIRTGKFLAPVITESKTNADDHGTKIVIGDLKAGAYRELRDSEPAIRRRLETIYTPILSKVNVGIEIIVQGKKLTSRSHCVWAKSRYVIRSGEKIPAWIEIDRDLGVELFDVEKNAYLPRDAAEAVKETFNKTGKLPPNIVERKKRLSGWLGVQRYADPNDFGIDFVRNGRKILVANKSLFEFENPITGTPILEYPMELASTWGGRIVGELHVDYLLPTYQKNDFDRTDNSWFQTVEAVRGIGPMLPKQRKLLSFGTPNDSPLSKLVNAYRRLDPGTKCLSVDRTTARTYTEYFRKGDADYATDDKWWAAAQEADKEIADKGAGNAPEVDEGSQPTDDLEEYGPIAVPSGSAPGVTSSATGSAASTAPAKETSSTDQLIAISRKVSTWSGPYAYGKTPSFDVTVWEVEKGDIYSDGDKVPCSFQPDGVQCDFFFNPRHPFFASFQISPRDMLAVYLSERFKTRDMQKDIGRIFAEIAQNKFQDVRIDKTGLQERAHDIFDTVRDRMIDLLAPVASEVLSYIHESTGEVEEAVNLMLSEGELLDKFLHKHPEGLPAISHVPARTIIRLVEHFPERLFDGHLFKAKYSTISLMDPKATERIRSEAKDRIVSFLKDAGWVLAQTAGTAGGGRMKDELARCSHSIRFLEIETS